MNVTFQQVSIKQIVKGYIYNDKKNKARCLSNHLNLRPSYQRNYIYDEKQQKKLISSIKKGYPINSIYWCGTRSGNYECLDGQQRIITICKYVNDEFAVNDKKFSELSLTAQKQIKDYKLSVFICKCTEQEKLEFYRRINIPGINLSKQEKKNAKYTGFWLKNAKQIFSNLDNNSLVPEYFNKFLYSSSDIVYNSLDRGYELELALKWIADRDNISAEQYMSNHQNDNNCEELLNYFNDVIKWANSLFPIARYELKEVNWGYYYNRFKHYEYNTDELEVKVRNLMINEEVTYKPGVYEYLLDGQEKHLNIRLFTLNQKREAYEKQNGICPICGKHYRFDQMQGDHIIPWSKGGKTISENCQMLCRDCNWEKADFYEPDKNLDSDYNIA